MTISTASVLLPLNPFKRTHQTQILFFKKKDTLLQSLILVENLHLQSLSGADDKCNLRSRCMDKNHHAIYALLMANVIFKHVHNNTLIIRAGKLLILHPSNRALIHHVEVRSIQEFKRMLCQLVTTGTIIRKSSGADTFVKAMLTH
jgi:hypothetical protein